MTKQYLAYAVICVPNLLQSSNDSLPFLGSGEYVLFLLFLIELYLTSQEFTNYFFFLGVN